MHADRIPTRLGQALVALAAALALTACKTEKDPDQPTVLGTPARVAYLGVEYYYNFGVYGGDGILEFSLTNAPSWLALEDTSNKARQGIIMRGVPGMTGGNRGEEDLGKTVDVTLLTTDGQRVGLQPFDIDVRHNTVSLEAEAFREGQYPEQEASDDDNVCDLPDLGQPGSSGGERRSGLHAYTSEVYDGNGEVISPPPASARRSKETTPVLVKVLLAQPSVSRIRIAFELESDFDPASCDGGFSAPHQRCTHSTVNRGRAMIGQDVVGLGSDSRDRLEVPEYLEYLPDDDGNLTRGVITLEPGITECYIRLEVISDDVPESSELFDLTLTDVREGLAALGSGDDGVSRTLTIRDNQTSVIFETQAGYPRDVINADSSRSYRARLDNRLDSDATYRVRLGQEEESSAVPGDDYIIEVPDADQPSGWRQVEELEFNAGVSELSFRVVALNDSQVPVDNDKLMVINADERFQDGREFYAAAQDNGLRLTINELVGSLEVGSAGDFAPSDLTLARNGEIALVGVDMTGATGVPPGTPLLVIYDRKGALVQALPVADVTVAAEAPPVVTYGERSARINDATVTREEIAVAFGSRNALSGAAPGGGVDAVQVLFRYDSAQQAYEQVWQSQTGTAGDDLPRDIAMDRSGNLFVGGETTGTWPVQPAASATTASQNNQGGSDSYIQRIDTELDGNDEVPALAWTRQQGSPLDEQVHALGLQSSSATLVGTSRGSVGGQPQLGGVDLFYYSASSPDGAITVRQGGTQDDDRVQDAILQGNELWLTAAPNQYSRLEQTDDNGQVKATLTSTPLASAAASVLGFSSVGNSLAALTLDDQGNTATDQFDFLVRFAGDIVTAGFTSGQFTDESGSALSSRMPILARIREVEPETPTGGDQNGEGSPADGEGINVEEDDDTASAPEPAPALEERWRVQEYLNGRMDGLVSYRDDKLIALIREGAEGSESWQLLLFTGEGRRLNPAVP